jgi:hypothetical protein
MRQRQGRLPGRERHALMIFTEAIFSLVLQARRDDAVAVAGVPNDENASDVSASSSNPR